MKKILSVILVVLIVAFSIVSTAIAVSSDTTTIAYRYENKYLTAKLFYTDFSLISQETLPIPGLENTNVLGEDCSCMTPQGLCATEKYIFISAYCAAKKYSTELEENKNYGANAQKLALQENHTTHNSVIYIVDKISGEYVKNLVLPDTNHVGGLATDGENIFVAKSTDKQVSVITLSQIQNAIASDEYSVKAEYDYSVDCSVTASFVTYYNDILWVGVFDEENDGALCGFTVDNNSFELSEAVTLTIPAKANGASFTEINGEVCFNVNSSYGRKNLSDVYLYSVTNYGAENMAITLKDTYKAPPTIQNSCFIEDKVLFIFESAATCYSEVESSFSTKATTCAIDRICIGDADMLFNWHCEENIFLLKVTNLVKSIVALSEIFFNAD